MKILKSASFYIGIILLAAVGYFAYQLNSINILPLPVFAVVCALLLIVALIACLLSARKNWIVKIIGWLLAAAVAVVSLGGSYYIKTTYDALETMAAPDETMNVTNCYVLRTGAITKVSQLEGRTVGYLKNVNTQGTDGMIAKLKESGVQFNVKEYDSSLKLIQDLKGVVIDAAILNESYLNVVKDFKDQNNIAEELVSIDQYAYATKKENHSNTVNVTTTPFTLLISGIDTYGSINEVSRSDVNLLLSVNPETHNILILSIPRDYYLETVCDPEDGCANGKMDKLTHTGLHGIQTTEKTLEKYFDVDINYNVRVNFSSLISIVDELGGITVHNPNAFTRGQYNFKEGDIKMDGQEALEFSRERYSFEAGDRERGRNQIRVLTGIINRAMSPAVLKNYSSILKEVSKAVQTNMSVKDMTSLIKMQISKGGSWNIYSYSVNGSDAQKLAYELGDEAYVMIPNEDTVKNAISDIRAIENGEIPPYVNQ